MKILKIICLTSLLWLTGCATTNLTTASDTVDTPRGPNQATRPPDHRPLHTALCSPMAR